MKSVKALAAAGLALCLVMLGGFLTGPAAASTTKHVTGDVKVNVCHATGSDSNPFVFIRVDANSTKLQGHLQHRNDPNKTWKSDGVFLGHAVKAGDPKPDRIGTYTFKGVTYRLDGVITSKSDCGTLLPPPVVAPSGSFAQVCSATGATVTIGTLDDGTVKHVVWTLTFGVHQQHVVSGDVVAVTSGDALKLSWAVGDAAGTVVKTETALAACPNPPVVPPTGSLVTPTCTATGALVDIGTLSQGSATGGSFRLTVNGVPQAVTSGQQDVVVAAGAALVLTYVPASGSVVTLDTKTAPAACPPVVPPAGTRDLAVTKSVSPTGSAKFGDTLTYTLTVSALGTLPQTGVTVTDKVPTGTSYVLGSVVCKTGCTSVTVAHGTVTMVIGDMAAGTSRDVSFRVTIDKPATSANGGIPAVTIRNSGAVVSAELTTHHSNIVETPVAAVEGVKVSKPATSTPEVAGTTAVLPRTGTGLPPGPATALALLLVVAGAALLAGPEVRQSVRGRR